MARDCTNEEKKGGLTLGRDTVSTSNHLLVKVFRIMPKFRILRLTTLNSGILMGKRELVALLNLSSWCLMMMVEWLFLAVLWGCLQFVIVVFPDHTHYFSSPKVPN